jgi:hypothetical protein
MKTLLAVALGIVFGTLLFELSGSCECDYTLPLNHEAAPR